MLVKQTQKTVSKKESFKENTVVKNRAGHLLEDPSSPHKQELRTLFRVKGSGQPQVKGCIPSSDSLAQEGGQNEPRVAG